MAVGWNGAVCAEGPQITASLTETGVMDSNPLLRTTKVQELWGVTTTPRLTLSGKTPTSKISLASWIDHNVFNRSEFDTTDAHGVFNYSTQAQIVDYGVQLSGDADTTRTSEVTPTGLETGLIHHLAYAFAPNIGFTVSPISRMELTGSYYKSSYDNASYVDYHTVSVAPTYIRNFSELYAGVFSMNGRRYESQEGPKKVVDSVGPSVGVRAKLTQKLTAKVNAGREASREKVNGVVTRDWTWNTVFSGELTFKGDQDSLKLSAVRSQQSFGSGANSILTSFSASEDYKVNPYLSANLMASYQYTDSSQTAGTDLDVLYIGGGGLAYHATEVLDLNALYRYKNKTFTNTPDKAEENVIRMGLSYHPHITGLF